MAQLPQDIITALDGRKAPAVFATADSDGRPNAVYVSCVYRYDEETIVVADNFFNKTRANIKSGSDASLVFITEENKAYQIKGKIDYVQDGPLFDFMKENVNPSLPGHAAAALRVGEVYAGADRLV